MSALRGDIQIAPQEIYTSSSTQLCDVGARAVTGDGRVFRYALAGSTTALVAGQLHQGPALKATAYTALSTAAAGTLTYAITTTTTTTLTANELAGGIVTVRSGSGAGYSYKVKSHPAATAAAVTFTLEDPIQIGLLASSSIIDVAPNNYNGVIVCPTTLTGLIAGVPAVNVPATQYGWVQTRGLCAGYSEGAITLGSVVGYSAGTAGAIPFNPSASRQSIGYAAMTTTDQKYDPFFLTLE